MAFSIIYETSVAPREVPNPTARRWRERGGILFINQKRGRKPKARLRGPLAPVITFPVDPIEALLREHARVLWAADKILYPDDEETISFKEFAQKKRFRVDLFRDNNRWASQSTRESKRICLGEEVEKIRRELANGLRCLEDHAAGVSLAGYIHPSRRP